MVELDAECPTESGRATRQVAVLRAGTALAGDLDAVDDLAGADQHRARGPGRTAPDVAAHVHAVGEVAVQVPGRSEHHRVARRLAAEGVRAGVVRAVVRLDLGETYGDVAVPEPGVEQSRCRVEHRAGQVR